MPYTGLKDLGLPLKYDSNKGSNTKNRNEKQEVGVKRKIILRIVRKSYSKNVMVSPK